MPILIRFITVSISLINKIMLFLAMLLLRQKYSFSLEQWQTILKICISGRFSLFRG